MRRKIPLGQGLPPIFRARIGWRLERVATLWYINRIPGSPALSIVRPALAQLLAKTKLNDDEAQETEEHLTIISETLKNAGREMKRR